MTTFQIAATILFIGLVYFFIAQNSARQLQSSIRQKCTPGIIIMVFLQLLWRGYPPTRYLSLWRSAMTSFFGLSARTLFQTRCGQMQISTKLSPMRRSKIVVSGTNFGTQPDWVYDAAQAWQGWIATSTTLTTILCLSLAVLGGFWGYYKINPNFRSRNAVERIIVALLAASSVIAILTTVGIIFSVVFESLRFFALVPVSEFLFGFTWNPQFEGAERAGSGQMGLSTYGSVPLFAGTMLISAVALTVAVPVGLFSAIYLSEYASDRVRGVVKPLMELLAGVPTVVYGFFAALTVAPFIRSMGLTLGLDVASESALAAGLVMGIMIIPFISSLSDDVIRAVPQALREAAYALGSTQNETIRQVVLPAALPGVVASVLLAVSRAVG